MSGQLSEYRKWMFIQICQKKIILVQKNPSFVKLNKFAIQLEVHEAVSSK